MVATWRANVSSSEGFVCLEWLQGVTIIPFNDRILKFFVILTFYLIGGFNHFSCFYTVSNSVQDWICCVLCIL